MEIKVLCQEVIAVSKRVTTYCMARKGHEGLCVDQPENKDLNAQLVVVKEQELGKKETCGAVNPRTGAKCGLPKDFPHDSHSDGSRGWNDLAVDNADPR